MPRTYSRDIREGDKYRLFEKSRKTDMLIDNNEWIQNELRSYMKDFSTEKPNLEFEQSKSNMNNVRRFILDKQHGSGIDVYQPDLFLGDMTKDPRGTDTQPLMSKYKQQMWDRKDNYRKAFVDDDTRSEFIGVKPQKAIQEAKNKLFYTLKSRLKNFGSTVEMTPMLSNVQKSNLSRIEHSLDMRKDARILEAVGRNNKSSFLDYRNVDYSKKERDSKELVPSEVSKSFNVTKNKANTQISQRSKVSKEMTVKEPHHQTVANIVNSKKFSLSNDKMSQKVLSQKEVSAKSYKKTDAVISREQLYGQKSKEELVSAVIAHKQKKANPSSDRPLYTQKPVYSKESNIQLRSRFTDPAAIANTLRLSNMSYKKGKEMEMGINNPFVKQSFNKVGSTVFDIKHKPVHAVYNYGTFAIKASGKTRENLSDIQHKYSRTLLDTTRPAKQTIVAPSTENHIYSQNKGATKAVHPAGALGSTIRMPEKSGKRTTRMSSIIDMERRNDD